MPQINVKVEVSGPGTYQITPALDSGLNPASVEATTPQAALADYLNTNTVNWSTYDITGIAYTVNTVEQPS